MPEVNKEALVQQIGELEQSIEAKKTELAEVQAKLGGPTEAGKPPVDGEQTANVGENGGAESEQLKQREQELISEITADQMKLVALKKQLEELNGNETIANIAKEE